MHWIWKKTFFSATPPLGVTLGTELAGNNSPEENGSEMTECPCPPAVWDVAGGKFFSPKAPRVQARLSWLDGERGSGTTKPLQSCPTLCYPIDSSPPGSPVPGILQARTLEWVAISFPNAWKWKVKVKLFSCVWPSMTPWTAAFQAPPSMGFSRQEYLSRVPLPSPGIRKGRYKYESTFKGSGFCWL